MSTENRSRVAKGVKEGGQFARESRSEAAGVALEARGPENDPIVSPEPRDEEQQVPEALLREYFHPSHADVLDVNVPEDVTRPTVVIDVQDDDDGERYTVTADLEAGTFEVHDAAGGTMARGTGARDALSEHFGLPIDPEHYREFHRKFMAHDRG